MIQPMKDRSIVAHLASCWSCNKDKKMFVAKAILKYSDKLDISCWLSGEMAESMMKRQVRIDVFLLSLHLRMPVHVPCPTASFPFARSPSANSSRRNKR